MAFPATYNIAYYQGDTYEFVLRPLDSTGNPFNLDGYTPAFKVAKVRGSNNIADYIGEGSSTPDVNAGTITCEITALFGSNLVAGTNYVYDVAISKDGKEYTLVTGNISVTAQVIKVVPP